MVITASPIKYQRVHLKPLVYNELLFLNFFTEMHIRIIIEKCASYKKRLIRCTGKVMQRALFEN